MLALAAIDVFGGHQVADGAAVSCGFGYEGTDAGGNPKWNGVNNVDILGFEFAEVSLVPCTVLHTIFMKHIEYLQ